MGLFRLLTFILVVLVAWRMIKNYQAKVKADRPQKKIPVREKIVKCEYCTTHIPEDEAIADGEIWFCKQEHKELFYQNNS
tara:strand:- start:964 stop:1203 length:240 start_codon:yes stop_codon:yes gene_type:complete